MEKMSSMKAVLPASLQAKKRDEVYNFVPD
jgi:hypothetical protein